MPYPFWDVMVGYGPLMAAIAVIHVFVSHFAIGGGLYLVVAERSARKAGDEGRLLFVKKLSKFFVLTTVVFGALTGVMIWFIIGLLNPKGTEALIHNFVWAWATEWTFFFVEILAAILYFYGWKRMSAKNHMRIGWIYFWAAWASLVVIVGIITFMLTPGKWLETGNFWDGFLNPTYASSVFFRTGVCILMAGLFALLVAARYEAGDLKTRLVRGNTLWALAGLLIAGACWFWYKASIPDATWLTAKHQLSIAASALERFQWATYLLFALLAVLGLLLARMWNTVFAILLMVVGLYWFGSYEWFRESARKPYVIPGYMYANGMRVGDEAAWRRDGLLSHVDFRTGDDGADLWRYSCRTCHQVDGYNPVKQAFDHTDPGFIAGSILGIHKMKRALDPFPGSEKIRKPMPPFMGSEEEAKILAEWLWERVDQRPMHEAAGLSGPELGAAVYELRCARCHAIDGPDGLRDPLEGESEEDLREFLSDPADGMPALSGDERDQQALLDFILGWYESEKGGE